MPDEAHSLKGVGGGRSGEEGHNVEEGRSCCLLFDQAWRCFLLLEQTRRRFSCDWARKDSISFPGGLRPSDQI